MTHRREPCTEAAKKGNVLALDAAPRGRAAGVAARAIAVVLAALHASGPAAVHASSSSAVAARARAAGIENLHLRARVPRLKNSRQGISTFSADPHQGESAPKPATAPGNFRICTTETQWTLGIYYFGARYYDPRTSIWVSPDPILASYMRGEPSGGVFGPRNLGLYTYAWNNPVILRDPTGLATEIQSFKPGEVKLHRLLLRNDRDTLALGKNQVYLGTYDATVRGTRTQFAAVGVEGERAPEYLRSYFRTSDTPNLTVDQAKQIVGAQLLMMLVGAIIGPLNAAGGAGDWSKLSGMLRDAAKGKGNYGIGSGTAEQAGAMGKVWVGEGYKVASDGKTLISADGLRQFRPPSFKPNLGKTQANFERRFEPVGQWQGNAHLDIE